MFSTGSLKHRAVWSLDGLTGPELVALLDMARAVKAGHAPPRPLRGKHLAVLRDAAAGLGASAFEQAAQALGAKTTVVPLPAAPDGETRLLGRLYDAIDVVGLDVAVLDRLERSARVPVFNGLADHHLLARVLAVLVGLADRATKPLGSLHLAWVGDIARPPAATLLHAAVLAGVELRLATPRKTRGPAAALLRKLQALAPQTGARLYVCASAAEATEGADAVLLADGFDPVPAADDLACVLQAILMSTLA